MCPTFSLTRERREREKLLNGFDNRSLWARNVIMHCAAMGVMFQSHAPQNCNHELQTSTYTARRVAGLVAVWYTRHVACYGLPRRLFFLVLPDILLTLRLSDSLSNSCLIRLISGSHPNSPPYRRRSQQRAQGLADGRLLRSST